MSQVGGRGRVKDGCNKQGHGRYPEKEKVQEKRQKGVHKVLDVIFS